MNRSILAMLVCLSVLYAGDVQVDTNGNLIIGTDPGGAEALRSQGVLRAGNVLSGQSPVTVTEASPTGTLTDTAFGKWHLVSGTTGDYVISLPAAAASNQGKCIGFRVLDATAASKTYTVTATGGATIDGSTTQALVANGNLVLMSDGTNWARIGGTSTGSGSGGTSIAALTDWQDGGTVGITGTTTNPTKGAVARDKIWWRRVGDSAEVRIEYEQSSAGGSGSGDYLFSLPAGLSIDLTKVNAGGSKSCVGGFLSESMAEGSVLVYDSTRVYMIGGNAGAENSIGSAFRPLSSSPVRYLAYFTVPVVGWSGAQVVQQGGRYLWAQRYAPAATRVTATPTALGQYRARNGAADTAPTSVPSQANGVRIDNNPAAGLINYYDIYVGPGKVLALTWYSATGRINAGQSPDLVYTWNGSANNGCGTMLCYDSTAGVATIKTSLASGWAGVARDLSGNNTSTGYFDLLVADDPVPVAIAPAVHVEAFDVAGQALAVGSTVIQYATEVVDTHNAWNGTVFTAPVPGVYSIVANSGGIVAAGGVFGTDLYKNGTLYMSGAWSYMPAVNWVVSCPVVTQIKLVAGDQISFRAGSWTGYTRGTDSARNFLTITRMGD